MKVNGFFRKAFLMLIIFCAFTVLVSMVDVQAVGPDNSYVGLARINGYVKNLFPFNDVFYILSEILGYIGVLVMLGFVFTGFIQLLKRRKIFSIDSEILSLAVIYIVFAVLYVFFDKFMVINFRPYVFDGELEPSYPSTHTLLSFVAFVPVAVIAHKRGCSSVKLCAVILAVLTVIFRILSGVHWITDIIAGVLLGLVLIYCFVGLLNKERVK